MEYNFFNLVKEKFFAPLNGRNKEVNYLLLKMINENMKPQVEFVERNEILSWIRNFYEERPNADKYDDEEDGKNREINDVKSLAAAKLAYFEKTGWLFSENTTDFKTVYQMDSAAIGIIDTMNGIVERETRPVEYTGYVYGIYSLLQNFEISHATQIVEQIKESAVKLNDSLRGLNNSIKKYLQALVRNEKNEPKAILDALLNDYQKNVISKAFNNLRTLDNPSKYRNEIINKIEKLLDENLDALADNYIAVKHSGQTTEETIREAKSFFTDTLYAIEDQFNNIDSFIMVLDERNTKYVSSAKARAKFLVNNEKNIEGKVYDLLKAIELNGIPDDEEFSFHLLELGKIDDTSLYTYTSRKRKVVAKAVSSEMTELSEEEKNRIKQDYIRQSGFSISEINKYIMEKLGDKKQIEAKDIIINNYDDLIKLFLCQIYAESDYVSYFIKVKDSTFTYNNSQLTDFIIFGGKR